MHKYKKLLAISIALVLILITAGATVAFTQIQEPAGQTVGQQKPRPWARLVENMRKVRRFRQGRQLMDAALADELEISVDELAAARQAARLTAIQQAAGEGLISEERADLMLAHAAMAGYIERHEVIAQVLGIPVSELAAAREEGQNIRQLASELGLDGPTLRENMKAVREATIRQATADGIITEEQAELLLASPAPRPHPRPRPLPNRAGG